MRVDIGHINSALMFWIRKLGELDANRSPAAAEKAYFSAIASSVAAFFSSFPTVASSLPAKEVSVAVKKAVSVLWNG